MAELAEILDGTAPAIEPETVEQEQTGEAAEPAEAKPDTAPPAEKPQESTKPPPDFVPRAALHDERRKRQELEARLKALEDAKPQEQQVGLLDDPEKWEQQLQARVNQEVERVRVENQAQMLNFLEAQARGQHADFDDVIAVFADQAKANPLLAQEALKHPNPVEFAYTAGRRLKMLSEAGDLDALLERERKKAREEALAEMQGRQVQQPPESLTEISGAKSGPARQWSGPKPLGDILQTR